MDRSEGITKEALNYVIDHIREHDLTECRTLYPNFSHGYLLRISALNSIEKWTFTCDGEVVAVGGVSNSDEAGYCVWLIGTHHMDKLGNQKALLREGRRLLKDLVQRYYRLSNYCSDDPGQVWAMEKLGFTVKDSLYKGVKHISICAS